jgi:hypothetical protein
MATVQKISRSFQFISDFILGIIENIPTNYVWNSGFKSTITNMVKEWNFIFIPGNFNAYLAL